MEANIDCDAIYLGMLQELWGPRSNVKLRRLEYAIEYNYKITENDVSDCLDIKNKDTVTTYDCSNEFLELGQTQMVDFNLNHTVLKNLLRQAVIDSGGSVP